MSKKSRARGPFDKEHSKGNQTPLKSEPHIFYHVYWSLRRQVSWKKSSLVICKILGLFVKILNASHNNSLLNRQNLKKPIQMQLSQKQKLFSQFVAPFSQSLLIFEYFQKKLTLIADAFPKLRTPKNVVKQMSKKASFRGPLDKEHSKRNQTLLKFEPHNFYHI